MVVVKHYLDLVAENGQAVRMDIQYAKIVIENINEIKLFVDKYEIDKPLNPILEVK